MAMSNSQRPTCGRAAYQSTIRFAVWAGSNCIGWIARAKSEVMNRTAGKMRSNSAAAVVRLIVFINHFVLQSDAAVNKYFALAGRIVIAALMLRGDFCIVFAAV